jgi:hypothetical protein
VAEARHALALHFGRRLGADHVRDGGGGEGGLREEAVEEDDGGHAVEGAQPPGRPLGEASRGARGAARTGRRVLRVDGLLHAHQLGQVLEACNRQSWRERRRVDASWEV